MNRPAIALAVAVCLPLAACGESSEDKRAKRNEAFMAEHGEALKGKAASLKTIAEDAAARARLTADAPPGLKALSFEVVVRDGDASIVHLEWLTEGQAKLIATNDRATWMKSLERYGDEGQGKGLVSSLRDAAAIGHLLVLRTHEFVDPARKVGTVFEFQPGRLAGDALLYELASGKYLGGFPWEASSSEKVKASMKDAAPALRTDLAAAAQKAIAAKLPTLAGKVTVRKR